MKGCALMLAAAVALVGCAEKSDKKEPPKKERRTGTRSGGTGDGTGAAAVRPTLPPPTIDEGPPGPKATLPEARAELVSALAPIADGLNAAMTVGCARGTDRVAAMFREADDGADDLHLMMRDASLRSELQAAIASRSDPSLAKVLSKLDTSLIGCRDAADQARLGIDRLLQPAVFVPQ